MPCHLPDGLHFRPFDPLTDYPAIAACRNANWPQFPLTESELRYQTEYLPADRWFQRWVVESSEGIVAYAQAGHQAGDHHPDAYRIEIHVAPQWQRQGIGGFLYARVDSDTQARGGSEMRCWAREDALDVVAFLTRRSHRPTLEARESWCRLADLDIESVSDPTPRLAAQGVAITTFAEFSRTDPDAARRWWKVSEDVGADAPANGTYQRVPFETWSQRFQHPGYRAEAQFLAVEDGMPVGVASLWHRQSDRDLETGVTGVLASHRGRGIATALKLAALRYARAVGAPVIRTDNVSTNVPMIAINHKLGFVPQPAWVQFTRTLDGVLGETGG